METYTYIQSLLTQKGAKTEGMSPQSNLRDIGIDSLDLVDVILEVEKERNITFNDEELLVCKTVLDVVNLIDSKK